MQRRAIRIVKKDTYGNNKSEPVYKMLKTL